MDLVLWCAWGAAVLVLPATGLVPRSRPATERAVQVLARRCGLAPGEAVRERIVRRLVLRRRWSAVGGAAGMLLLSAGVGVASRWQWSPATVWTLNGGAMTTAAIGSGIAAMQRESPGTGARIARATAVVTADYVPLAERIAARLLPLIGLVLIAAAVAGRPDRAAVPLAGAGLVLGAVLLFETGAGRILRTPQPAGSVDALAWDDALRSTDLRALAIAPMAAGAYAGFAAGWSIEPAGDPMFLLAGALAAVVVAVFAMRALSESAGRHYLRRLWPGTASALEAVA